MATSKLSDLQLVLLSTAAQRPDGSLLPPPETVAGQMARIRKAIPPLLKRALVEETPVSDDAQVWQVDGDTRIGLVIAAAGRAAIGAEEPATEAPVDAPVEVASAPGTKPSSKIATVTEMLRRDGGATLPELVEATGWLPHTTRAALTGLRKKGHAIEKTKRGDVTCYTMALA